MDFHMCFFFVIPLHWRHNDHDCVSNHQPYDCLLNRLFRHKSKKTSKLRVTGLCVGNSPGPVNSPHKGPVTRKMLLFDDVIMWKFTWNAWCFFQAHSMTTTPKRPCKAIWPQMQLMSKLLLKFATPPIPAALMAKAAASWTRPKQGNCHGHM